MTWKNRLKMFLGTVVVFVLVAGMTVIFNQRQAQVTSASAAIEAERYPVGSDYGGTVLDREVSEGDRVAAGDVLFRVQSPTLQADLAEGLLRPETVAYAVTPDGVMTLTATVDGTVGDITAERGSFVQAGQILATIDRTGSLFVSADFVLSSRDYARIEDGAAVELVLPNQSRISGQVESIDVQTSDGLAETTVTVSSEGLVDGAANNLMTRGTPVSATLLLRDDGPLAGVGDGFFDFMRKIGL
ncbi:HlyD family efflux transporter periplasmic adaptor subunit [Marisediminicola sp. LYQ134]|uniref:HlyD family efflux transporter periplasmic adaptor subunit n=1 Tax=unclassified Marisediminicola TaxID=2618316 RepID=UPI003983D0C9